MELARLWRILVMSEEEKNQLKALAEKAIAGLQRNILELLCLRLQLC
jgi:hypothetical protein